MNRLISPGAVVRMVVLLTAAILCSCREVSVAPRIERTASGVEGFDLVFDDSAARAEFGLFDLGYAAKANYGYFTYRGKLYRSVGGGSVVIRPITNSPAKFLVRETALSKDERGYAKSSLLQILDKGTGEELARRGLVSHAIEDGTGWTGDHAVKFVRKVLSSPQAPGRPWGAADYQPAVAKVELAKSPESSPYPAQVTPKRCPETLRIERRPHSSTIRGPSFEFLPRNPLQLVACGSERILVASGVYASDLYFDLLTFDGEHIAQGYVRLPLPLETRWADIAEVDLGGRIVKATLLINGRSDWRSASSAYASVHVNATQK
ncbi:hypothetical protein [Variovorax soli]|uniref:Uncharacterized protein n=1 Tax=Variovorax soli TaxID=376815 RepID=A0ABU1N841_9BURK|nr:hypothetical protein [Variovorax soli]MDR6534472.1 hypothetical protein [Variovorax soli]